MKRHGPILAVLGVLAAAYALTVPTAVLGGDNGEFATLFARGGVAHPSGYPLYVAYLRLLHWLPCETPAQGAAIATLLLALGAVTAVHAAALAWGASEMAALFAATLFGLSPLTWDLGSQAEVFTLNTALGALILLVAAPSGPARGARRVVALAFLAGLGLSNHHSITLLAPAGVCGVVAGLREARSEARRSTAWVVACSLSALALGLLPYAWLLYSARTASGDALVWGDPTTPSALWHHFLRTDYGTFSLSLRPLGASVLDEERALFAQIFHDLRFLPPAAGLVLVVASLVSLARSPRDRAARALGLLAASFVLAGPIFFSRFDIPTDGTGGAVLRRFCLLPEAILVVFIARALTALSARWPLPRLARVALVPITATLALLLGLPELERERRPTIENYLVDTLASLPERSVLLGSGDQRVFGFAYAGRALRIRRDVVFMSPILLHHDWYRRRLAEALGVSLPAPRGGSIDTVDLSLRILASGRPLFLTDFVSGAIQRALSIYPIGTALRVLPPGERAPAPGILEEMNGAVFARFAGPARWPAADDSAWAVGLREAYARPWSMLAEAYTALGRLDAAERCRLRARSYAP